MKLSDIKNFKHFWHHFFLKERSSLSLSLFRIPIAFIAGSCLIPTFFVLEDTYFSTAFKTYNGNFFPLWFLEWVAQSPEWLIITFVWIFVVSWFFFLIGFLSQISCIVMFLSCYFFYALNAFAMGTLSWDIMLVTLFLMCITNYHGDYFSLDALLFKGKRPWAKRRPYFLQRLLQLQVSAMFFYTALHKITMEGNWLTANPYFYLMNYPPHGVVKNWLFKDWLGAQPELCYVIGISVIIMELFVAFGFFIRKTRRASIILASSFCIMLVVTLDVPFFLGFLIPFQTLLFIRPDHLTRWARRKQRDNRAAGRAKLYFDGDCSFCRGSVECIEIMDFFGKLETINYQALNDKDLPLNFTKEDLHSEIHLVERGEKVTKGFFAFQRMSLILPILYPLIPVVYFPGMSLLGPQVYKLIANNRYFLHAFASCRANKCRQ